MKCTLSVHTFITLRNRLHKFAEENNEEAVAELLKQGVNPNSVEEQVGHCLVP